MLSMNLTTWTKEDEYSHPQSSIHVIIKKYMPFEFDNIINWTFLYRVKGHLGVQKHNRATLGAIQNYLHFHLWDNVS